MPRAARARGSRPDVMSVGRSIPLFQPGDQGNAIRGVGTTRSTGLNYEKGNGTALTVVSTGNLVTGVAVQRNVGTGVTVSAGQ